MITAEYKGYEVMAAYGLTQYDYGQTLTIEGIEIPDGFEIHFCQNGKAITQYIKNNSVLVPDYMLQYPCDINAYIYRVDVNSGETIKQIVLHVSARERPGYYVEPEEPAYSRLLPQGGEAGQILTRGPTGYEWVDPEQGYVTEEELNKALPEEATELEIIQMMEEMFGKEYA